MSTRKDTKTVSLSQEFLRASAGKEIDALAFMIMAAFGVSLTRCLEAVRKAIAAKAVGVIMMMVAAAVQVRGNVVFVGRDFAGLRADYPALVVEGERPQKDVFNYGALHVCGHIIATITKDPLGGKILAKAGSCVSGGGFTENEAGKINKEMYMSWAPADIAEFNTWIAANREAASAAIDGIIKSIPEKGLAFGKLLSPAPPSASA